MGGTGSGGARLRSGPAPDPNALRRDRDGKDWVKLDGPLDRPAPPWPTEFGAANEAELGLWKRLWETKPQARVWAADHCEEMVALYVRILIDASDPTAPAARATQAKQLAESLLLTTPALLAARYTVNDLRSAPRSPKASSVPRRSTARAMLAVVEPDHGATED